MPRIEQTLYRPKTPEVCLLQRVDLALLRGHKPSSALMKAALEWVRSTELADARNVRPQSGTDHGRSEGTN